MKISQKMIAELSGVSRGTVDRVIHGKPNVKPETRERVLEAIKKLDYTPNMVGRALAFSNRSFSVCAVLPDNPFFGDVREGINAAADELSDYNFSVLFVTTNGKTATELIDELESLSCDAFMLAVSDTAEMREWIKGRVANGTPILTFNTDIKGCGRMCFVGQELYKSGRIAASLMIKLIRASSAEVLIITGDNAYSAHRERVQGFMDVLTERSADIRVVEILETYDDGEIMRRELGAALKRYPNLDGIYVAAGDAAAFAEVLSQSDKKYYTVVNDLSPVVKEMLESGIVDFTILQDPFEQGYRPVKLLFQRLFEGRDLKNEFYYTNNAVVNDEMI